MADFTIGEKLKVTLFGQSHGPAIGCVIDGFPAGITPDWESINAFMARRVPGQNAWSTPRKEADQPEILSGINADGATCGAPITAVIRNSNTKSGDYEALKNTPRPGHADYTARVKYGDAWDGRGGGQFSARLTAPLCFAGALAKQLLEQKGITIAAHIARIGSVEDAKPDAVNPVFPLYTPGAFPVIDPEKGEAMRQAIQQAREAGDSIGGAVRCLVTGVPAGWGGPYFGGIEGKLAQALFGIPAVKGVEFGDTQPFGSENDDAFCIENGAVRTVTNHSGGILGGITNGMPLVFTVSFKPTPSISKPQQSVNLKTMQETELTVQGRHDPCVVPRAVPVVEAAAALVLADMLLPGA
ncbi:MAG: chorismate synthase [Clostridia bacterium]|nr:chorismate synthase [Clostridia bacterium]